MICVRSWMGRFAKESLPPAANRLKCLRALSDHLAMASTGSSASISATIGFTLVP